METSLGLERATNSLAVKLHRH